MKIKAIHEYLSEEKIAKRIAEMGAQIMFLKFLLRILKEKRKKTLIFLQ